MNSPKKRWPYTYNQCVSRTTNFKTGEVYMSSKIAPNTYLERRDDCFCLRLHATDLLYIYNDGTYKINVGIWKTKVTFDRLSSYCPLPVKRVGREWLIMLKSLTYYPIKDGMHVTCDGVLLDY